MVSLAKAGSAYSHSPLAAEMHVRCNHITFNGSKGLVTLNGEVLALFFFCAVLELGKDVEQDAAVM